MAEVTGTESETRNEGGRPLKFPDLEALQEKIDAYFKSCFDDQGTQIKPITITGLALALDTTRETLCDYAERDGYSDTIKRAKLRVEQFAEEQLYLGKNAAGPIFALKNFGWKDTQARELTGKDGTPLIPVTKEQRDAAVAAALAADS